MKEVGTITGRIKMKGGLNALCWAGAGYLAVQAYTKYVDWSIRSEQRKLLKKSNENLKVIDDLLTKVQKQTEEQPDITETEEATEEAN